MDAQKHWEALIAVVLVILGFFLLVSSFIPNLESTVPPVSLTYDNFYHPLMGKAVRDSGQEVTYVPYRGFGTSTAVIGDPPLPYSMPAMVSMFTTVPYYNVFFILVVLLQICTAVGVYAIIRKYFNANIALLGLALALIPTTESWFFQLYIGFSTSIEAFAFVPLIIFLLAYGLEKKSWLAPVLAGLALATQLMIHGPIEASYTYAFLSVMLLVHATVVEWKKRDQSIKRSFIRHVIYLQSFGVWAWMTVCAVIVGLHQYILLQLLRLSSENLSSALFVFNPIPAYFPRPVIPLILYGLAIFGGFFLLMNLYQQVFEQNKNPNKKAYAKEIVVLFVFFLIAVSASFLVGVDGSRAMRQYYNSYPFFVLLPAMGIYVIVQFFKKYLTNNVQRVIFSILILAFVLSSFPSTYAGFKNLHASGLATGARWEAIEWVRENTPKESIVFFLFGFDHEVEMLSERVPYKGDAGLGFTQRNLLSLCNGTMPSAFAGQWGGAVSVRKGSDHTLEYPTYGGFFNFPFSTVLRPGTHSPMPDANDLVNLSMFDYVVFQHRGTNIDQCMLFFISKAMGSGWSIAWQNDQFTVMIAREERK